VQFIWVNQTEATSSAIDWFGQPSGSIYLHVGYDPPATAELFNRARIFAI